MIVKQRLLNFENKYIYQDDEYFNFSLDSLLLANFMTLNLKDKVIVDFCAGNAPILMLLTYKTKAALWGVELQKEIYQMAISSIEINNFMAQINMINDDVKNISNYFKSESVDAVVCNPPYFKWVNDKMLNENRVKALARHEIAINIEEILQKAFNILKYGGRIAIVHRTDRLMELILLFNKYHFAIKKMQFVYPKVLKNSNMVLIEGVKNGREGLTLLSPMYVHLENGNYTEEIRKMFQE